MKCFFNEPVEAEFRPLPCSVRHGGQRMNHIAHRGRFHDENVHEEAFSRGMPLRMVTANANVCHGDSGGFRCALAFARQIEAEETMGGASDRSRRIRAWLHLGQSLMSPTTERLLRRLIDGA